MTRDERIKSALSTYDYSLNSLKKEYEIKFDNLPMIGDEVIAESLLKLNKWYDAQKEVIKTRFVKAIVE